MLKTRVIPCLLLKNLGLVKTVKFKEPKYVGDPINTVKIFNDKEVDELVFLDITASVENKKPAFKYISQIASECFMPLGYGGGIKTIEDIKTILNLGVEKVVINTHAVENPNLVEQAASIFGSQSIVISLDIKKNIFSQYQVYIFGGRKAIKANPLELVKRMENMGAGEILINSINRDGTMNGYDLDLIRLISGAVKIPVIACGGAGKLQDLGEAVQAGASALAAGSMFVFQGIHRAVLINYPSQSELKQVLK